MNIKNIFFSLVLGLISGALTVYVPPKLDLYQIYSGNAVYFDIFPGLFFGLSTCLAFIIICGQTKWLGFVGFVLASIIAYMAAFWATLYTVDFLEPLSFFFGGCIGAFLSVMAVRWMLVSISIAEVIKLSLWGGVLGFSVYIPIHFNDFGILFLVWQPLMLLAIMYFAKKYLTPEATLRPSSTN